MDIEWQCRNGPLRLPQNSFELYNVHIYILAKFCKITTIQQKYTISTFLLEQYTEDS